MRTDEAVTILLPKALQQFAESRLPPGVWCPVVGIHIVRDRLLLATQIVLPAGARASSALRRYLRKSRRAVIGNLWVMPTRVQFSSVSKARVVFLDGCAITPVVQPPGPWHFTDLLDQVFNVTHLPRLLPDGSPMRQAVEGASTAAERSAH